MKLLHLNHEKLLLIAVWVGLIGGIGALGRELPVTSVIDPTVSGCDKATHRNDLDDACKVKILENNVIGGQAETISNLVLSVLRGSSYSQGRIPGSGGHPSIDLVSVAGTPVFAIYDGYVVSAQEKGGYGNTVTIRHTLPDGKIVYSNYSHLEEIMVLPRSTVTSGKQIGTIGKTGFTIGKYGNHLDFQITTQESPSHPYGYGDCSGGYMSAVEQGLCFEKLEKYTIDPLVFYRDYAGIDLSPLAPEGYFEYRQQEHGSAQEEVTDEPIVVTEEEEVDQTDQVTIENDLTTRPTAQRDAQGNTIAADNTISSLLALLRQDRRNHSQSIFSNLDNQYAQLGSQQEITTTPSTTVPGYRIEWELGTKNFTVGRMNRIVFSIKDVLGNDFNGELPEKVSIVYNDAIIEIVPARFGRVVQGKKSLFITPIQVGQNTIQIFYGDTLLGTETITVSGQ